MQLWISQITRSKSRERIQNQTKPALHPLSLTMPDTVAETETPKMKPRPMVRLGILLISHSVLVSVLCCVAAVVALLLLPALANNTYISENALMPGSASSMLTSGDVFAANKLVEDLGLLNPVADGSDIESRRLVAKYMSDLGAEVSFHKFQTQRNQFHPLHFFSDPEYGIVQENFSCSSYGISTVGIIRAPRGDGKEAIVLVTPFNFGKSGSSETLSLSIVYSVFSLLARVNWLAKDIVWLVADSQYGEYTPVDTWLRDYYTPVFTGFDTLDVDKCGDIDSLYELKENPVGQRKISDSFRRAGAMAAALIIKVADKKEQREDTISIYAEASNGQMPNLDLINIVNSLAVHRQGLRVKIEKVWSFLEFKWLEKLGEVFELLGKVAGTLNPEWRFGIPAADYIEGTATLASSLYYQALGIPTGPHGAFRDFQVDAITLEISPKSGFYNKARHNEFVLRGGRLIEGVIRSVNNLLEKFHQSFFLYFLTGPSKYVSNGVYMIAFALLVAPLPLVAASLYVDATKLDLGSGNSKSTSAATGSNELEITFRSWKWLNAAREVFVVHVWGTVVALLPYFICQIPDCSSIASLVIWVFLSILSLLILYLILGTPLSHVPRNNGWVMLKSVTILAVFIGLVLMSIVNFATAEIGALILVPLCLMAHPLKLGVRSASLRSSLGVICNLVLGVVAFPPAAFFLLRGLFEGFDGINVGDFWNWMETLWAWNSATYVYIDFRKETAFF